jgi:hypothetical protein
MTIDELASLQRQQARRLAEAQPFSPERDAAKAAIDDFDEALEAQRDDRAGPERPTSRQADAGSKRGES